MIPRGLQVSARHWILIGAVLGGWASPALSAPRRVLHLKFLFAIIHGRSLAESFSQPGPAACDSKRGEFYIPDSSLGKIFVFDERGRYVTTIRSLRGTPSPLSVALGPRGDICVVNERPSDQLFILDFRGRLRLELKLNYGEDTSKKPVVARRVAWGKNNRLYVTDAANRHILIVDPITGRYLNHFGEPGKDPGQFESISDIAIDRQGRVIVVDMMAGYLTMFDEQGKFIRRFGEPGSAEGNLAMPNGVSCDAQGRTYVVDRTRHSILAYDEDGNILFWKGRKALRRDIGGMGREEGWLYFPAHMAADDRGHILVTEPFLKRVQVFSVQETREEVTTKTR